MAFLYLDPLTDRRHPLGQAQFDSGRRRLLEAGPGIGINRSLCRVRPSAQASERCTDREGRPRGGETSRRLRPNEGSRRTGLSVAVAIPGAL